MTQDPTKSPAVSEREGLVLPQSAIMNDIAVMMSKHVDNWPNPKRFSTAIALIDKTLTAALARLAPAAEKVVPSIWSKEWYAAADNARSAALREDPNDQMSALASAVDAAIASYSALAQPEAARVGEAFELAAFDLFDAACMLRDAIEDARPGNTIASSMSVLRKALAAFDDATPAPRNANETGQDEALHCASWLDANGFEAAASALTRHIRAALATQPAAGSEG